MRGRRDNAPKISRFFGGPRTPLWAILISPIRLERSLVELAYGYGLWAMGDRRWAIGRRYPNVIRDNEQTNIERGRKTAQI